MRRRRLAVAQGALAAACSEAEVAAALAGHARAIAGADRTSIVRREADEVRCIAEDAPQPYWAGRSFPVSGCIAGTAMLQNRAIIVPDVLDDLRIPIAVYPPDVVRCLALFPIGIVRPLLAVGAYWAAPRAIDAETTALLRALAGAACAALDRIGGGGSAVARATAG